MISVGLKETQPFPFYTLYFEPLTFKKSPNLKKYWDDEKDHRASTEEHV